MSIRRATIRHYTALHMHRLHPYGCKEDVKDCSLALRCLYGSLNARPDLFRQIEMVDRMFKVIQMLTTG